jgi:hypothetical protein
MSGPEMDGEMESRLRAALAELRQDSAAPARPEAVDAARRAMHLAVAARRERGGPALVLERVRRALTVHRLMAAGAGAAMGLATVTALGWNAAPGAPLHVVEVAHEQIALALPGADRAALDLSFAESRLEEAAAGNSGALDEAQRLLDDAHSHLPADHSSALWARWGTDSRTLAGLREARSGGGEDHGGVPGFDGSDSSSGSGSGEDRSGGGGDRSTSTTTSSTTASRSGEEGGDGGSTSTSSTESRTSSSSTTTSGGDHEGGGSSSSSSSTSTTTSGGGGGGPDVGSGSSSTSTTSTGSSEH